MIFYWEKTNLWLAASADYNIYFWQLSSESPVFVKPVFVGLEEIHQSVCYEHVNNVQNTQLWLADHIIFDIMSRRERENVALCNSGKYYLMLIGEAWFKVKFLATSYVVAAAQRLEGLTASQEVVRSIPARSPFLSFFQSRILNEKDTGKCS